METRLVHLLEKSGHRTELAVAFALLWLATADGFLDAKTYACLDRQMETLARAREHFDELLSIVAADNRDSFLTACRVLHRDLSGADKQRFLEMAIVVAGGRDGLSPSRNHLLRLYQDLMDFSPHFLQQLYCKLAGEEFPEPGDPGSPSWWEARDHAPSDSDRSQTHYHFVAGQALSREAAYAALGLTVEASRTEVKRAYRRLVQTYHPDRYELHGQEAQSAAEINFLRVREAYEVLNR